MTKQSKTVPLNQRKENEPLVRKVKRLENDIDMLFDTLNKITEVMKAILEQAATNKEQLVSIQNNVNELLLNLEEKIHEEVKE